MEKNLKYRKEIKVWKRKESMEKNLKYRKRNKSTKKE